MRFNKQQTCDDPLGTTSSHFSLALNHVIVLGELIGCDGEEFLQNAREGC